MSDDQRAQCVWCASVAWYILYTHASTRYYICLVRGLAVGEVLWPWESRATQLYTS